MRVGDKVRIKTIEEMLASGWERDGYMLRNRSNMTVPFNNKPGNMAAYCGLICTITAVNNESKTYTLSGGDYKWIWIDEMFVSKETNLKKLLEVVDSVVE